MKNKVCGMVVLVMTAAMNILAMPSYDDVLVVINDKSPASVEVGEYFKNSRKISAVNVVHVSMADKQGANNESGQMSQAEKETLVDVIKKHMVNNNLADKINYIVLTRGIPMYATSPEFPASTGAVFHLTDIYVLFNLSESATDNAIPDIFCKNKYFYYYNPDILNKKFSSKMFGYYIVSRLDGPGVNNIKKMIDDTGFPAYGSYKKNGGKAKFLTLHQAVSPLVKNELKKRNIELVQVPANPTTKQLTATMDTVAKDVMFAFFNNVAPNGYGYAALPADNNFYADGDMVGRYPFIYRGATFLPGSFITCFRSYPALSNNRVYGGLGKITVTSKTISDFRKYYDGSDMKFRHMTCVAYDPASNQIWCGTGEPALNVDHSSDERATDEVHREHMRNEGGGIAIFDAVTGNILNHIDAMSVGSPLINNRVVKIAYDGTSKRMWIAHYKGIQYFDLVKKTWHGVPVLQNDFAAISNIYLDPFDSDKLYFSCYYSDKSRNVKISSSIAGASSSVFEYSKSLGMVTQHTIDTDAETSGVFPLMAKTDVNTLWISKGRYYYDSSKKLVTRKIALYRYDIPSKTVAEKFILNDLIPEIKAPPADLQSINIDSPRTMVAVDNSSVMLTVGCDIAYNPARVGAGGKNYAGERKTYLFKATLKSGAASQIDIINGPDMNCTGEGVPEQFYERALIADTQDNKKFYMALSWPSTYSFALIQSFDKGATWSKLSAASTFTNLYDITMDNNGTIYAVRGYQNPQNIVADFMAFGLNAFGGGITHDNMMYNPSRMTPRDSSIPAYVKGPSDIYYANPQSIDWVTSYSDAGGKSYEFWNNLKTYKTGDSITYGSWAYVSTKDNNIGNPLTPVWQTVDISNVRDYLAGTAYVKNDFVNYKGKVYVCLISNSTYAPDSDYGTYFWKKTDISNIGDYSSSAQYASGNIVLYNSVYYVATAATQGSVPGVVYWQKTSTAVTSSKDPISQAEPMMFMYTDGFSIAEARFATQAQYPQEGGGGWTGHFLVFDPKCAPFAPRVDEENMNPMIPDKKTIEIPLRSPGLALSDDGFIPETINNSTVTVKDELGKPVAATIAYVASGNKIVLTGDFSGLFYQVTLKCGINGIKNIKGASLTNMRVDEFKDEVTYTFGISTEIYTPPADVTAPVKMPATNSKCDLIVSRVWWTGKPVVGQPLTVNFQISNLGTAKTNGGAETQKAKVYLNNVLADIKTYNDIAPKGKVSLAATIPGASIVGGKQNKVMVWADATNKVTEIRETNNTNSASFMIETRPDLIVKEITLSPRPKAKAPLTINFKISNTGASATAAGVGIQIATVFVDSKPVGTVTYDDVTKGGSIVKQLALPSGIATAGTHKIKVSADTNKVVDEINENNNYLEKSFSIAK